MFTIVFQREYISILYQKYVYKWEKIAIFWIWSKVLLLLLLVFNRFFDESFGNFCGLLFVFRVLLRGKSRPAAYQITRTHNLYLNGKL